MADLFNTLTKLFVGFKANDSEPATIVTKLKAEVTAAEDKQLIDDFASCYQDKKTSGLNNYSSASKCYDKYVDRAKADIPQKTATTYKAKIPDNLSPRAKKAYEITAIFFKELSDKGVRLTGDEKTDREVIGNEWKLYREKNDAMAGIGDAAQVMDTWFNVGNLLDKTLVTSKTIKDGASLGVGFLMASVLLGLDLTSLLPSIPSDNFALVGLTKGLKVGTFGIFDLDLEGINSDVGGAIDMRNATFGMMGQIFYNPLLDKWLSGLKPADRPIAQNALFFVSLFGLLRSNMMQDELIDITWAERYQPAIKPMVQELMKYLLSHGDMGIATDAHRHMSEVNKDSSPYLDALSYTLRGGFAVLLGMNAWNNARMYVKGSVDKKIIGENCSPNGTGQSTTFACTSLALAENNTRKGYAMMMNDALFMSDIIMQTTEEILNNTNNSDHPIKNFTPLMAFGLVTLIFGLGISQNLSSNPGKALKGGGTGGSADLQAYIEKYKLNQLPDDLYNGGEGSTKKAATDTFLAFLFGGLESVAAGYTGHRKEVIDSFGMVNNMIGTNPLLTQTAANSAAAFSNSGQGPGDRNYAITTAMNTVATLDAVSALWAGLDSGATAYLAGKPTYLEWSPLATGLIIRSVMLAEAYKSPNGAGHDKSVTQEWTSMGLFVGGAALGYALSYFLGEKFDYAFEFGTQKYSFKGKLIPAPGGAGLEFTFGGKSPEIKSEQELLHAKLETTTKELNVYITEFKKLPENDQGKKTLQLKIIDTRLELASLTEKLIGENINTLEKAQQDFIIYSGSKDQKDLIVQQLKPRLEEQRRFLARLIAQMDPPRLEFPPKSLGGGRSIMIRSFDKGTKLSKGAQAQLNQAYKDFAQTENDIQIIEKGNSSELADLYKRKSGQDIQLAGFNVVIKEYCDQLKLNRLNVMVAQKILKLTKQKMG